MPPFGTPSACEPNETLPGATAYTAVPPGAATSIPKWNVRPPAAIRGWEKNPRPGCCGWNSLSGQGYGAGLAVRATGSSEGNLEAVDARVVGCEGISERAAGDDDGSEVFA